MYHIYQLALLSKGSQGQVCFFNKKKPNKINQHFFGALLSLLCPVFKIYFGVWQGFHFRVREQPRKKGTEKKRISRGYKSYPHYHLQRFLFRKQGLN